MHAVLGSTAQVWAIVAVSLLAVVGAPTAIARRFVAVAGLLGFGVLLNPLFAELIAGQVTGKETYWRVFWALPIPVSIALAGVALRGALERRFGGVVATTLGTAALVAFLVVVPSQSTLSSANRVRMASPGLKVPAPYRVARAVVRHAPPQSLVLAPKGVSAWLPTFRGYVHPVLVKPKWLRDVDARREREGLQRCVANKPPEKCGTPWFERTLDRLGVAGVVASDRHRARLGDRLTTLGFSERGAWHGHALWLRDRVQR